VGQDARKRGRARCRTITSCFVPGSTSKRLIWGGGQNEFRTGELLFVDRLYPNGGTLRRTATVGLEKHAFTIRIRRGEQTAGGKKVIPSMAGKRSPLGKSCVEGIVLRTLAGGRKESLSQEVIIPGREKILQTNASATAVKSSFQATLGGDRRKNFQIR